MAVVGKIYGAFFVAAFSGLIDWEDHPIKCLLTTSDYTPNQDAHSHRSDITNEVSGAGYTAGGVTLGSPTITYTGATNKLKLDADDAEWTAATITARTAVVYDGASGVAATDPLVCYQQSDTDIISTNGTFNVVWHADGIVEITLD